ncbi:MAG: hypothetical protein ITG02_02800 [Patulibacter sp.]|nr:hypothetical protein [Patulibacter sp.]
MTSVWSDLDDLVRIVERHATHLQSTIHGPSHWRAVGAVAAELAGAFRAEPATPGSAAAGPDRELLFLFALLHDAMREDDGRDLEHGPRAEILLERLRIDGTITLTDPRAATLGEALRDHTNGTLSPDPTIGVCWDADRLLIGRVGIVPDARFCSTVDGRRRAVAGDLPDLEGPESWQRVAAMLGVAAR